MTLSDIEEIAKGRSLVFLNVTTPIQANDYIEWINQKWCHIVPNSTFVGLSRNLLPYPHPQVIRIDKG
jgi:hypothetical protein